MNIFGDQKWIVYILPGSLALFMASFISDLPDISDTQLPVAYIALTLMSVAIPILVFHLLGRLRKRYYPLESVIWSPVFIVSTLSCSIILGLTFGILNNRDIVLNGLRSIFSKTSVLRESFDDPIHLLFKNSQDGLIKDGHPYTKSTPNLYARIYSSEGRTTYEGVVASYSESDQNLQVYLTPACLISEEKVAPIKGPGAWINLDKVTDIQFIEAQCSACAEAIALEAKIPKAWACPFDK